MFCVVRFIGTANATMRNGEWNKKRYAGTELSGKRLGLIGFGRIARETARKARALGMKIYYTNKRGDRNYSDYKWRTLEDLLKKNPSDKDAIYLLSLLDIALYNVLKAKKPQFYNDSYKYKPSGTSTWKSIVLQDLITIWAIKDSTAIVKTDEFPSGYWESSLNLVHTGNSPSTYKVMLIWGKHPTFNTSTFKVYRSLSSDPNGKYKIIASIDQKDFYYQDLATDYYEDPPKYYYVKAYNGSYSGRTNIGSTLISKSLQKNVKSAEKQLIVNMQKLYFYI